jgi:hypothetical protein
MVGHGPLAAANVAVLVVLVLLLLLQGWSPGPGIWSAGAAALTGPRRRRPARSTVAGRAHWRADERGSTCRRRASSWVAQRPGLMTTSRARAEDIARSAVAAPLGHMDTGAGLPPTGTGSDWTDICTGRSLSR